MSPDIVQALVKTIEMKDLSTAAHTWRVVLYTRAMAEEAGLPHERTDTLSVAAALHDVGKIDIPDHILQKPDKLTDEEFKVIQTHAALGHDRLTRMDEDDPLILDLVRHHHERWDGKGYPDRIAGSAIPIPARYFAVIDSFDAMTSIRPYRSDVGADAAKRALAELEAGIDTRYWAEAVEMFTHLYNTGRIDWVLNYFNDRCPVPAFTATTQIDPVTKALRGNS